MGDEDLALWEACQRYRRQRDFQKTKSENNNLRFALKIGAVLGACLVVTCVMLIAYILLH